MSPSLISIVIPVRNEAAYIERCIESIYAQDSAGREFEVLAVDGMSDDGTAEKLQKLRAQFPNLKVLENPRKTVSSGVNLGIRQAKGGIIFRMDAHAEYESDYVKTCMAVMEETGAANVGGPAIPLPGRATAMARAIVLAHYSPFGLGGGRFRNPEAEGYVETVWPGCFRREALEKAGLLDERLTRTEDIELNARIRRTGYRIYLTPGIKAYYYCRATLRELWQQRWLDGIGVIQTLAVNSSAPRLRHFAPLAFAASLLILGVLSVPWAFCRYLLAAEIGLYLTATAAFSLGARSIIEMAEKNSRIKGCGSQTDWGVGLSCLLPPVFAALHFSYGLGSLWAAMTGPAWWARFHKHIRFEL